MADVFNDEYLHRKPGRGAVTPADPLEVGLYGPNEQPISQSNPLEVRVRDLETEIQQLRGLLESGDAKVTLSGRLVQRNIYKDVEVTAGSSISVSITFSARTVGFALRLSDPTTFALDIRPRAIEVSIPLTSYTPIINETSAAWASAVATLTMARNDLRFRNDGLESVTLEVLDVTEGGDGV